MWNERTGDSTHPFWVEAAGALPDMGNANARKLVWFLTGPEDICCGGFMNLCHFHAETRMLLGAPGVAVCAPCL